MKYNYTEDQRHAITTDASCLLLLGSAGTGKTHVLVERISYLVQAVKIDPKQILILTSSVNDVYNITKQLDELMDSTAVSIYSVEMFALKMILEKEGYHKKFLDHSALNQIKLDITDSFLKTPKQHQDYMNNPKIFPNITANIQEKYEDYLTTYKVSVNENFVSYALKLLKADDSLKTTYQQRFSHIFIDNAQDYVAETKLFINQIMHPVQNHFVLGNDDQMMHDLTVKDTLLYEIYKDDNFDKITLNDNYKTNNTMIKFSTIVENNNARLMSKIKYMRQDPYIPKLDILESKDDIISTILSDIQTLIKDPDIEPADIAIITGGDEAKSEVIQKLEEIKLITYVAPPKLEDTERIIEALNQDIEVLGITSKTFFEYALGCLDDIKIDTDIKLNYRKVLNMYVLFDKNPNIKGFILFIQAKAYQTLYTPIDYNVNVLTLNETKGLDFKYVCIPKLTELLTNNLEQSRRILYNVLFTARDRIYLFDTVDAKHEVLDEILHVKNNWNKIKLTKSRHKDIILEPSKTYLRTEHKILFEDIKLKYKTYPKLYNELTYLIELIESFDKRLSMQQVQPNMDIYMQAFRYFIQHTLKVTLDVTFNETREGIYSYLSGGSAGVVNFDRDYEALIKQNSLNKAFTKSEFKAIHDIYRYLSATHHKQDDKEKSKTKLKQATLNITIYRKLSSRDKIKYFVAVIRLYHLLNLNKKQLHAIESKIE